MNEILLFSKSKCECWKMHSLLLDASFIVKPKVMWELQVGRPSTQMLVQEERGRGERIHTLLSPLSRLHHACLWFVPYLFFGIIAMCRLETCKVLKESLRLWLLPLPGSLPQPKFGDLCERYVIPCHFFNKV